MNSPEVKEKEGVPTFLETTIGFRFVSGENPTLNGGVSTLNFTGAEGNGAVQISSAPTNRVGSFGNSSGSYTYVVYKGTCPISTSTTLAGVGVDYTINSRTSTVTTSGSIQFNVAGAYTIFITSNNASGATFQLVN